MAHEDDNKVIIQVSFCFETEIENRVLRVLSIDLQKHPFTCDKVTRNEAETIFTLFMNMTVVRHNWRVDVRRSAVRPGVAKIDVSLSGKTVRNVLDWAVTGISATTPSRHEGEGIIPVSMIVVCRLRDNRRRTTQIRSEYPNRTLPYPHRLAPP